MSLEKIHSLRKKIWRWLKDQIAQDVPEEVSVCEFDCHEPECTEQEWATCERRIDRAAGELFPMSSSTPRAEKSPTQTAPQFSKGAVPSRRTITSRGA